MTPAAVETFVSQASESRGDRGMIVCLIPLRRNRFELYSEPPEASPEPPGERAGRWARWAHAATLRWHHLVEAARRGTSSGRLARWRDGLVRHLAESLVAQRTLWALRYERRATLLFSSALGQAQARAALDRSLVHAIRHHGVWATVDLLLFAVSAVVAPIPGPNVIAYYLAFRAFGHVQSWRGARHAMAMAWTLEPDANLAELAALVDVPSALRASRVADIAARLGLHRLSAHFERVAV